MKIHKLDGPKPLIINRQKVAAYVRVSKETERLNHSLSAQISYYNDLIQSRADWEFAGVYVDRFVSGTGTEKRLDFQRMLDDCEAGKIDIILTKSISRFARNTVDLLNIVRYLKNLGISVRFEKENIDSLTSDGELLLSILAGFAEEESKSISTNIKWSIRKKFENGIQWKKESFGYRWNGETFLIQEEEAAIVREIYSQYLEGIPVRAISRWVNEQGFPKMSNTEVTYILKNEIYRGDLLLQKNFIPNPLDHKHKKNRGELPQYYVSEDHEPIVQTEVWQAVQEKMKEKSDYIFTKKIICGICGSHYCRGKSTVTKTERYQVWRCYGKHKHGKEYCHSPYLREDRLKEAVCQVLNLEEFDEGVFKERVEEIRVVSHSHEGIELTFHLYDGTIVDKIIFNKK